MEQNVVADSPPPEDFVPPPETRPPVGVRIPPPGTSTLNPNVLAGPGSRSGSASQPADVPERVITRRGDVFFGRVIGLSKAGLLRFASPQFDGEVRVKASELVSLELSGGRPSTAPDTVVITNGDRLAGRVTGITADSILLDSDAAARLNAPTSEPELRISRKVVQMIAFGQSAASLSESNFTRGIMEPWVSRRGDWKVEGGKLVCTNGRGNTWTSVKAPLKQDGPVAIEITVEAANGRETSLSAGLFVDDPTGNYIGNSSVFCRLESNQLCMGYCQGGSAENQVEQAINATPRGGSIVMRFAYDPAVGESKCWINGDQVGVCNMNGNNPPQTGKWLMVGTSRGCKIRSIRVTGGEFTPGEVPDSKVEIDTVMFTNKDHVTAKSLTLADGQLHVETAFGELASPVGKLSTLLFASDNRETPRLLKNQALVQTEAGNVTVQLESLDGQSLVGKSDYLGPVTIRRTAIKAILFEADPSAPGLSPMPDRAPVEGMGYRERNDAMNQRALPQADQ